MGNGIIQLNRETLSHKKLKLFCDSYLVNNVLAKVLKNVELIKNDIILAKVSAIGRIHDVKLAA